MITGLHDDHRVARCRFSILNSLTELLCRYQCFPVKSETWVICVCTHEMVTHLHPEISVCKRQFVALRNLGSYYDRRRVKHK